MPFPCQALSIMCGGHGWLADNTIGRMVPGMCLGESASRIVRKTKFCWCNCVHVASCGGTSSTARPVRTTGLTVMINMQKFQNRCDQYIYHNDPWRIRVHCNGGLYCYAYNDGWSTGRSVTLCYGIMFRSVPFCYISWSVPDTDRESDCVVCCLYPVELPPRPGTIYAELVRRHQHEAHDHDI